MVSCGIGSLRPFRLAYSTSDHRAEREAVMGIQSEHYVDNVSGKEPPAEFPFLWFDQDSGCVWLRNLPEPHGKDICIQPRGRLFNIGDITSAGARDTLAWSKRLPANEKVSLYNTAPGGRRTA